MGRAGRSATVCYMKDCGQVVTVRQLRQNLSVYLRRVPAGESSQVSARGRVVALLQPVAAPATPLARLVAAGRARPPQGDLLGIGLPPSDVSLSCALSSALAAEREERL